MRYKKLLFFISLIFIYILSVAPVGAMPKTNDKLNHIAGFFYLSFLGKFSYGDLTVFFGLLVYGILIELSQLFVPGHSCEFFDVVADCVGVVSGILLFRILKLKIEK